MKNTHERRIKGQALAELAAILVIIGLVIGGLISLIAFTAGLAFYHEKLALVCEQTADLVQQSGSILPDGDIGAYASAVGSTMGLTINSSNVSTKSVTVAGLPGTQVNIKATATINFGLINTHITPISINDTAVSVVPALQSDFNTYNTQFTMPLVGSGGPVIALGWLLVPASGQLAALPHSFPASAGGFLFAMGVAGTGTSLLPCSNPP